MLRKLSWSLVFLALAACHGQNGAEPLGASEDPPARTRAFMRTLLSDNAAYTTHHDAAFFRALADAQSPRVTAIACSDSRVQTPAFDANAENDVFMVRNIGNQVTNAMGSVEYGVEHLKTPVVLVLGHTGCGAVKAAMDGEASHLETPIKEELRELEVEKHEHPDARMWADAVVENVHAQVAKVLATFPDRVARKEVTVIGAVYDLRNDLHAGYGKVVVVDVNGVRDPAKLGAFEKAAGSR